MRKIIYKKASCAGFFNMRALTHNRRSVYWGLSGNVLFSSSFLLQWNSIGVCYNIWHLKFCKSATILQIFSTLQLFSTVLHSFKASLKKKTIFKAKLWENSMDTDWTMQIDFKETKHENKVWGLRSLIEIRNRKHWTGIV